MTRMINYSKFMLVGSSCVLLVLFKYFNDVVDRCCSSNIPLYKGFWFSM